MNETDPLLRRQRAKSSWYNSISGRMVLTFGALSIFILMTVELIDMYGLRGISNGQIKDMTNQKMLSLSAIADANKGVVLLWLQERRRDGIGIASSPLLKDFASSSLSRSDRPHTSQQLSEWFRNIASAYKYDSIRLIDPMSGSEVAGTGPDVKHVELPATILNEARLPGVEETITIIPHSDNLSADLHIIRQIGQDQTGNEQPFFLLDLSINLDEVLMPFLGGHSTGILGQSGEVILYNHEKRFLTTPNHPLADATDVVPMKSISTEIPARLAIEGGEGTISAKDYRGVQVMAAYRHIPINAEVALALVAKIDEAEALAPIKRKMFNMLLIILVAVTITIACSIFLAKNIAKPLNMIADTASRIENGEMSLRVPLEGTTELVELGKSFNTMVARVEESLHNTIELFTLFVEKSPIYAYIKEVTPTESRVLHASENFSEMLGIPGSKLAGKTMQELFPADFAAKIAVDDWAVISGGEVLTFEEEFGGRTYTTIKFPIVQRDKTLLAGYTIDITERKKAEMLLFEAQEIGHMGSWELNLLTNKLVWSDEVYRIFEIDKEKFGASYDAFVDAIHPDDREVVSTAYSDSVRTGTPYEIVHRLLMPDGRIKHVRERCRTYYDSDMKPVRSVGTVQDITELRQAEEKILYSLKEKAVLLAEIHHRVKNNMAIISSFLSIQSMLHSDPAIRQTLFESRQRINSMALVHEKLYKSKDFKDIDIREYIEELTADLLNAYKLNEGKLSVKLNLENIHLSMDTLIPFGLITNEIVTNAFKHAFAGVPEPAIEIYLHKKDEANATLIISDNGIGLPDDEELSQKKTLGFEIIQALVGQLNGELEIDRTSGTKFIITFPTVIA